jgi:hypothetical protein
MAGAGTLLRMALFFALPLSSHLYLFTTHITRTKIIVGVGLVVVLVAVLVVWLVMRRRGGGARQV